MKSPLPYLDAKPQGAADFYFAINATFRFVHERFGKDGWITYLEDLARTYFAPVNHYWQAGGLTAVANYWRAFFDAEPGAEASVIRRSDRVEIHVHHCPAIAHLRAHNREIVPFYCQHCYYLGSARARESGLGFRLKGGNGSCEHTYLQNDTTLPPQQMEAISTIPPAC